MQSARQSTQAARDRYNESYADCLRLGREHNALREELTAMERAARV